MKKTINLTVLTIVCLALFFVGSSTAREEKGKAARDTTSSGQSKPACKSLKYTQTDKDTILITEGFSYQKDRELTVPHLMGIKGVKEGKVFIPDEGSVTIPGYESAVNVTWEFTKPGLIFQRDGCIYTSKAEGATIKFTKEGVLVKDFKISEKSRPKRLPKKK